MVLSWVTIATALAVVGLSGHVLKHYNDTRLGKEWHLPLWPINIDVRPTLGLLVPAAIIAFCTLFYVVAALVPSVSLNLILPFQFLPLAFTLPPSRLSTSSLSPCHFLPHLPSVRSITNMLISTSQPHSRTALLTHTYLLTTTLSLILSIFALSFVPTLTYSTSPSRDTLHSFTCRLTHHASSFNSAFDDLAIPMFGTGLDAPVGFETMCTEGEVALGLMGSVGVLSLLAVGVAVWGVVGERKISRGRRERLGEKYAGGEGKA